MGWEAACVLSSWALLPMAALLAWKGSWLSVLYCAAATVAFLYHWHRERRYVGLDHGLAWTSILANLWLAVNTADWKLTVGAVMFILLAVERYYAAHENDERDYCRHHTIWHLWCGAAGVLLAMGYNGGVL